MVIMMVMVSERVDGAGGGDNGAGGNDGGDNKDDIYGDGDGSDDGGVCVMAVEMVRSMMMISRDVH